MLSVIIRKKREFSEEHKRKLSESAMGKKMPTRSVEHRKKISKIHKGKIVSQETRNKISKWHKGRPSSRKGVKLSDETKQKIREKVLIQFKDGMPEKTRKKISNTTMGRKQTPEHIRKRSEGLKGRTGGFKNKKHTEEWKKKRSEESRGEKSSNWQGGKSFELYDFEWTELLKHSIRTRDCFTCKICGKKGWVVHHIDYDKKNCNTKNLITLCNKCHAKTNHNRESWIGYFKKYE